MNKWTKKKVLLLVTILLILWVVAAVTERKNKATTLASSTVATSPEIALIPYKLADYRDTSTARRKRGQISIYLADSTAQVSQEALAATCMAAAKYYAGAYGLQALSIFLADVPGTNAWEATRLAQCSYSPDKGGWSGDQGWLWERVQAAPRGVTEQERQTKQLWGDLRSRFQKNGVTNEAALSSEIAKRLRIKPEQVSLCWFLLDEIDPAPYAKIKATGPAQ